MILPARWGMLAFAKKNVKVENNVLQIGDCLPQTKVQHNFKLKHCLTRVAFCKGMSPLKAETAGIHPKKAKKGQKRLAFCRPNNIHGAFVEIAN